MPLSSKPGVPCPLNVLQKLRVLRRESQRYSTWLEKELGISSTQLAFMRELQEAPKSRLSDVQVTLGIHQATASNTLEQLIKREFVAKQRDDVDRRGVRLCLTEKGIEFLQSSPALKDDIWKRVLEVMSPEAMVHLDTGLGDLLECVEALSNVGYDFDHQVKACKQKGHLSES